MQATLEKTSWGTCEGREVSLWRLVMANGMAGSGPCSQEDLAAGMEDLLKKLGFQNSLKACS